MGDYASKGLANGVGIPALVLGSLGFLQSGGLGGYAGRSDIGQMRKQFLLWHECGFGAQRISSCPPHEKITPLKHRKAAH